MFENVDWNAQQKGVDKVKPNLKAFEFPKTYNFAKMFSGCELVPLKKLNK